MIEIGKPGWGLLWKSKNNLDGEQSALMWLNAMPLFFETRQAARDYRHTHYAYIRNRPDLLAEPHGWTVPAVVKVTLSLAAKDGQP